MPRDIAGRIAFPPELAAAQRRLHASIEVALAAAIAERTGTDAGKDLYPRLVAGVVVSATQTAFDHWRTSDGDGDADFPETLRDVLRQVARGLPPPHRPSTNRRENTEGKETLSGRRCRDRRGRADRAHARL